MDHQPAHHAAHISIVTAIMALAAAVGFHFLFFNYQYGIAFVLFIVLLIVGVHVLKIMTGKQGNPWAYLFMIPLLAALVAEILYASNVVRIFGFLVVVGSLTLFTYWYTAPRERFWETKSLWPIALFLESFFPFPQLGNYMNSVVHGKRHISKVGMGILLAVPFMFIIGLLFVSADPFIQKTVNELINANNLQQTIVRGIWDVFAFIFFTSAAWAIVTRLTEGRRAPHHPFSIHADHVIVTTFLVMLNFLFLLFLGFQMVYFFGGETFIQSQGLTYSAYAREGFFQLLTVSIIVTFIIGAVYRYVGMKHWLIRLFSVLLILQTGAVIVSAVNRMMLYIDAFGLSVQRFWATGIIFLIALVLLIGIVAIFANLAFGKTLKVVSILSLFIVSGALLVNTEWIVASYNIDRFASGKTNQIDVDYITRLSSDAVPAMAVLAEGWREYIEHQRQRIQDIDAQLEDPNVSSELRMDLVTERTNISYATEIRLYDRLELKEQRLRADLKADWRRLVFSDYRAMAVLGSLEWK